MCRACVLARRLREAADDRGRVSRVRARCRENSRGTVHGADRVYVPHGGLYPRPVRAAGRLLADRRLHTPACHAAVAGHADPQPPAAGGLG